MSNPVFDKDGNLLDKEGRICGIPWETIRNRELADKAAAVRYLMYIKDEDPDMWIKSLEDCLEAAKDHQLKNLMRRVDPNFHGLMVDTGFFGIPKDPARYWDYAPYELRWQGGQIQLYRAVFPLSEYEDHHRRAMSFDDFNANYTVGEIKQPAGWHRLVYENGSPKYLLLQPQDFFSRSLVIWDGENEIALPHDCWLVATNAHAIDIAILTDTELTELLKKALQQLEIMIEAKTKEAAAV